MGIMGRPRKEIDYKEFEKLCALHCTKEEIAAFFEMNMDTLETRIKEHYGHTFSEVFAEKKGLGKISLRRSQWLLAQKNAAVAIFLGKNYLGQRDVQEIATSQPIKLQYSLDEPEQETLDVTPDEKQIEPTEG